MSQNSNDNPVLEMKTDDSFIPTSEIQMQNRQHSSDSECSSASENSDDEIPWKRSKIHNKHRHITTSECSEFIAQAQHFSEQRKSSLDSPAENSMGYRKPNCVWNNVLEEQGLVENLTSFGVHTTVLDSDRGCEGYHYSPKFKDKPIRQNYSSKMNGQFRGKRNFKDRHNQLPRMRREPPSLGVDENDSEEKVINAIATILREPKQDLIARSVNLIGKKKALELLKRTTIIEESGGLMTADGSRRRTAGGIYLLLIRKDKDITQEHKDGIFEEDKKLQVRAKREIVRARRRQAARAAENSQGNLTPLPTLTEILLKEKTTITAQHDEIEAL